MWFALLSSVVPLGGRDWFREMPSHRRQRSSTGLAPQICITMKTVVIFLMLVAACAAQSQQQYYTRYENVNADSIVQNDRVLLAYYKCVMDKGPCTKEGKNFKRVLPETLSTACARCSAKQKIIVRTLLLGIRAKSEPRFNDLLDKYDPDRSNREDLYKFLVTGN